MSVLTYGVELWGALTYYNKYFSQIDKLVCRARKYGYTSKSYSINRDYFMVGECVRFLFTSCEGSLNERVSAANE